MIYNGVSKVRAAEEQLKTAVKMFFRNEDLVSVHTLASAAQEILESLGKIEGVKSLKTKSLEKLDAEKRKELLKAMNQAKNSFKHADKDPDKITNLNPQYNEMVLWDAVRLYILLTQQLEPSFTVYTIWIYSKYHDSFILNSEQKEIHKKMVGDHTYEEKEYFLRLISILENKQRENITPSTQLIHFCNKNFGSQDVKFDTQTNVWNVFYTINGQDIGAPDEQLILNFYLKNVWAKEKITAEIVANGIVHVHNKNIIAFPFTAPDNITKEPAYMVFLSIPKEDYGYIHLIKILSFGDSAVSIIYSKKVPGDESKLKKGIENWLMYDLNSSVGATNGISNMGVDASWLNFLINRKQ